MIELVFVACLIAEPARCEQRAIPALLDVTEQQCMSVSQQLLAAWAGRNDGYRVRSWTCREVGGYVDL
jgi:hypothetical protein